MLRGALITPSFTSEGLQLPASPHPQASDSRFFGPWQWLLGTLLLIVLLQTVEHSVGWQQTLEQWAGIPPAAIVGAFVLFALSHLIRALRIYDLALRHSDATFIAVAKLSAWHQFANNLLPMRLGEAVFPLLLKRYYGRSLMTGLAQLLWLRALDLAVMALVIALILKLILPLGWWLSLLFCAAAALAMGAWLGRSLLRSQWVRRFSQPLLTAAPKSVALSLRLLLWTFLAWSCKLGALTLLIRAALPVPLATTLGGLVGAELSGILPLHGIAGAGSFEAAFWAGAALLGEPTPALLALAVNTHIFIFASTTIVALVLSPVTIPVFQRDPLHEQPHGKPSAHQ